MQMQTVLIGVLIFIVIAVMCIIIFLPAQAPLPMLAIETPVPQEQTPMLPTPVQKALPTVIPEKITEETSAGLPSAQRAKGIAPRGIAPKQLAPQGKIVTGPK